MKTVYFVRTADLTRPEAIVVANLMIAAANHERQHMAPSAPVDWESEAVLNMAESGEYSDWFAIMLKVGTTSCSLDWIMDKSVLAAYVGYDAIANAPEPVVLTELIELSYSDLLAISAVRERPHHPLAAPAGGPNGKKDQLHVERGGFFNSRTFIVDGNGNKQAQIFKGRYYYALTMIPSMVELINDLNGRLMDARLYGAGIAAVAAANQIATALDVKLTDTDS